MGSAISGLASGIGNIGGDIVHGLGTVAGDIGSGLGHAASWVGNEVGSLFGGGNPTGQPGIGTPAAAAAGLSQSIPNIASGASSAFGGGSPTSALNSAIGDISSGAGDVPVSDFSGFKPLDESSAVPQLQLSSFSPTLASATALPAASSPSGGGAGHGFNLGNFLGKYAVPGAVLAESLSKANQKPPNYGIESGLAANQQELGTSLQTGALAEMNGQLPGGIEVGIQQGLEASKAEIRSKYAGLGLSDSSTMEAGDIANAEATAVAKRYEIGAQLAAQGFSAGGAAISDAQSIYDLLTQETLTQDQQFTNSLAKFAGLAVDTTKPQTVAA